MSDEEEDEEENHFGWLATF